MAKHKFYSRYYAEDKDIFDLLKGSTFPFQRLLKIGRDRGIYLSEQETAESVIEYLGELPFDWPELWTLMQELNSEDKEEKLGFFSVASPSTTEKFVELATTLKERRIKEEDEAYTISSTKEGRVTINVVYTDFDPNTTRLKQRREKKLTIEAEIKDGIIHIRHHSNKRASIIINALVDSLPSSTDQPVTRQKVSMRGIRNAALRTKFFDTLMREMEGFTFKDVKDLRVDTLSPTPVQNSEEDDDEELAEDLQIEDESEGEEKKKRKPRKRQKEAEFKSIVKRMALSGEGLHASKQYESLIKDGFYISRAVWISKEKSDRLRDVLFTAEFNDSENADGFVYDIRWSWERDENGDLKKEKTLLRKEDKAALIPVFEKTALNGLKAVEKAASELATASSKDAEPVVDGEEKKSAPEPTSPENKQLDS